MGCPSASPISMGPTDPGKIGATLRNCRADSRLRAAVRQVDSPVIRFVFIGHCVTGLLPTVVDLEFLLVQMAQLLGTEPDALGQTDEEEQQINDLHAGVLQVVQLVAPPVLGLLAPVLPERRLSPRLL